MADQLPALVSHELVLIFDHARPLSSDDLGDLFTALARLYDERATTSQSADLQALIAAVSATLRNAGLGHLLEMIANDLLGRGLHELAAMTRAEARRSQGNTEPPLLA